MRILLVSPAIDVEDTHQARLARPDRDTVGKGGFGYQEQTIGGRRCTGSWRRGSMTSSSPSMARGIRCPSTLSIELCHGPAVMFMAAPSVQRSPPELTGWQEAASQEGSTRLQCLVASPASSGRLLAVSFGTVPYTSFAFAPGSYYLTWH